MHGRYARLSGVTRVLVRGCAGGSRLSDHLARQGRDFVISQALLPISERGEALVNNIELFAAQRKAQIIATLGESVTAAVLSEN